MHITHHTPRIIHAGAYHTPHHMTHCNSFCYPSPSPPHMQGQGVLVPASPLQPGSSGARHARLPYASAGATLDHREADEVDWSSWSRVTTHQEVEVEEEEMGFMPGARGEGGAGPATRAPPASSSTRAAQHRANSAYVTKAEMQRMEQKLGVHRARSNVGRSAHTFAPSSRPATADVCEVRGQGCVPPPP